MLVYPEISDKEEYDELNAMVEPLERFFAESGNTWLNLCYVYMIVYFFVMCAYACL